MIHVQDIVKSYGGLVAVDGCSLSITSGTITGLIGPNGAGKSTLFNVIAGFERPDSGKVFLENEDITGMPAHHLFHKGLVRTFQIPHEFDRMTVLENLMIVPPDQSGESVWGPLLFWKRICRQENVIRQRAEEVLEFLQLTHLAYELAGNLSGGQKKLLELGRTMMTEAKMVLLDEPGAGVNRTLLGKLANDIRRLNQEKGYTFCVIEHDMDLIMELCHPVVVMAQGKVLAQGAMQELRMNKLVQEAYLGAVVELEGQEV